MISISHGSYERLAIALNLVEDWGSATRHNTTICWMRDIQACFLRLPGTATVTSTDG